MFSCGHSDQGLDSLFSTCHQQPNKFKKIGDFIYHYDYQIGRGTYSQVYEGVNMKTQKQVAIKVIDLAIIKQKNLFALLYQEIELIQQLSHPNVIKCYEVKKSQNRFYIVTELCKKDNLEVLIDKAKNKRLPMITVEKIIFDIIEGLLYLAQKAIIHRDLKSANILFSNSGRAKIADFGFATYSLNQFKDNIFVGTPLYMTPQAVLQQKYSSKTDIWSFGVIVFQLLFGYAPLSNCKTQNQFLNQITQPVQIPKGQNISHSLQELLQGCLQPNSINRWTICKLGQCEYMQELRRKFKSIPRDSTPSQLSKCEFGLKKKQSTSTNTKDSTSFVQKYESNVEFLTKLPKSSITTEKDKMKTQIDFGFINKDGPDHHRNFSHNYVQLTSPRIKEQTFNSFPQKHYKTHANFQPNSNSCGYYIINNNSNSFKMQNVAKSNQVFMTQQPPTLIIKQQSLNEGINYINTIPQDVIQRPVFRKPNSIQVEKTNEKIVLQNPASIQNFSFFRGQQMTYKQAVSLIHYCRLLYKVMQSPRYQNKYLKKWLIFLIEDLKDNVNVRCMKENHINSLRSALNGYYAQYTESNIHGKTSKSQYSKEFIPQINSVLKILQNLHQIDNQNKQKGNDKELLTCLLQQTRNLYEMFSKIPINLQMFQKNTKCQLYLDWFHNRQKQENKNTTK